MCSPIPHLMLIPTYKGSFLCKTANSLANIPTYSRTPLIETPFIEVALYIYIYFYTIKTRLKYIYIYRLCLHISFLCPHISHLCPHTIDVDIWTIFSKHVLISQTCSLNNIFKTCPYISTLFLGHYFQNMSLYISNLFFEQYFQNMSLYLNNIFLKHDCISH